MKRFIAALICFCLVLGNLAPFKVYAQENSSVDIYSVIQPKNALELKNEGTSVIKKIDLNKGINEYVVSAVSETGKQNNVRIEISKLIGVATALTSGRATSSIVINTDIAKVKLDGQFVEKLHKKVRNGELYFEIKKSDGIEDFVIKRLIKDAKIEIEYFFADKSGNPLDIDASLEVTVPFTSLTTENVCIYEVQGTEIVNMKAQYKDNILLYNGSASARVLVSEENRVEITGRTIGLQGTISLVFYAVLEGVDPSKAKMMFWNSPQTHYVEETADKIVECSGRDENGFKFEYRGVALKDIGKEVYSRLVVETEDGEKKYSALPKTPYSVVKYAENMMKNKTIKPLLVEMLNYGAAAQEYFGSKDEAVNSILKAGEKATDFTRVYEDSSKTIVERNGDTAFAYIAGKTLMLEDDISIKYYTFLDKKKSGNVDEMGILFWTEAAYNQAEQHIMGTESKKVTDFEVNGDYKVFSYPNILSYQIYTPIYARVYTKVDGEYHYSDIHKYSVSDYAASQIKKNSDEKLTKLLRCLMLYGEEAKKYFGR